MCFSFNSTLFRTNLCAPVQTYTTQTTIITNITIRSLFLSAHNLYASSCSLFLSCECAALNLSESAFIRQIFIDFLNTRLTDLLLIHVSLFLTLLQSNTFSNYLLTTLLQATFIRYFYHTTIRYPARNLFVGTTLIYQNFTTETATTRKTECVTTYYCRLCLVFLYTRILSLQDVLKVEGSHSSLLENPIVLVHVHTSHTCLVVGGLFRKFSMHLLVYTVWTLYCVSLLCVSVIYLFHTLDLCSCNFRLLYSVLNDIRSFRQECISYSFYSDCILLSFTSCLDVPKYKSVYTSRCIKIKTNRNTFY